MTKRLYVGNLPHQISEQDLRRLFGQAGTIADVAIPTDRQTGRTRGFAFVEMSTDQDTAQAIRMFDGYDLEGRALRVNEAEERERRAFGREPQGFGRGPQGFKRERRGQGRSGRRAA